MKVMLAKKYINQNIVGWLMSEKLDGMRAIWDGSNFVSRNNKPIYVPDWFKEAMPQISLDGELWTGRGEFQKTISIVRKKSPVDVEWEDVIYKVFDAPLLIADFASRIETLKNNIEDSKYINILPHAQIMSISHMESLYHTVLEVEGEGLILRNPQAAYEEKRSSNMLKVKPAYLSEAKVIGWREGEGKYIGMLGSLDVEWEGKKFNIGSGLTDLQRASYIPLGSIITFKYQGLTNLGIPRFPIFIEIRDYE